MSKRLRVFLAFIAATLMVSGSSLMITSSAEATGGGNEDCPSGTTQLAKYNWQGGGYAEEGAGVVNVTGTAQSGSFTADSGYLVSHVIVKGSNNAKTVPFNPPVSSGSFNNAGLINNGGQTADISNVKFCGSKVPDQPDSKVTYSEWADGDKSCESKTVTQTREKTVTPYVWNGSEWVLDTANAVKTTETQSRPMTEAELKECAGDQPDSKVTYSEWKDGDKSCESKTVTQTRTKTVTPYKWNGSEWVLDTANATSTTETQSRPMTEAELKACEGTPPPDDSCPPLTGSVKTTLPDGSVVNGNIYTNKSDVYISGDQLGDVTTVYIRVTDPSGSAVLSDVKQVSVVDGSFGPIQLPTFADTPNNGDEYKVWVSSTTDFEQKCTKFDNFKVRGEEPPPPAGMSKFLVDCESLEIKAPTGVKPEDAEYQYYLDGQAIAVGSHELAPGDYTLTLEVDGDQVDSDPITVEECDEPPVYVVTVVPNQGACDVRTPEAKVTTGFASSIGYRLVGETTKFVYTEVPAGTYTLTLPGVNPGGTVSYEVVVTPLDDSAQPIVKGPFSFSVPKDCDEVPPCIEFQDEDAAQPCYVEREPDVRTKSSERSNCKLGGTQTTTTVITTTWEFNEETQQWESSETGTSSTAFEPFTAEQLKACDKNPGDNPETPTNDNPETPTVIPPHTGAGGPAITTLEHNNMSAYGLAMLLTGLAMMGALGLTMRRKAMI